MSIEKDKIKIFIRGSLFRRLLILFIIFGLTPTLILSVAPFLIHTRNGQALIEEMPPIWRLLPTIMSGIGFLIVVVVGGFITFTQLVLPVQNLAQGAAAISAGDYAYRVKNEAVKDEIADLTETFNTMAESIQRMRNNVEKQKSDVENTLLERENEFAVISQIAGIINRTTDLTAKLTEALEIVREALGPDILVVTLLNQQNGELALTAVACDDHIRQHLQRHCIACHEQGLIQQAIQAGEVLHIQDVYANDNRLTQRQRESYKQLKVRKIAIKPIIMKNKVLGAITFMRHEQTAVSQKTIEFVGLLTMLIATLIENTTLQSQVHDLSIIEERRRIASDLHDSVMQSTFTLSLTVEGLKSSLNQDVVLSQYALDLLANQISVIQTEMRTLIYELRPVDLLEGGLDTVLHQHANSLYRSTGITVSVSIKHDTRDLPLPIQQNLNRIAQEALSNIGRHSNAKNATMVLTIEDDIVTLSVCDDGDGFDLQATTQNGSRSLGLISMRERAELLNGALLVRSASGAGTTIITKVPLSGSVQGVEGSDV